MYSLFSKIYVCTFTSSTVYGMLMAVMSDDQVNVLLTLTIEHLDI